MQNTVRKFRWTTQIAIAMAMAGSGVAVVAHADSATGNWAELIQTPPTNADQQQRDRFTSFNEALANKSYSEAEITAKQMVESVNTDAIDAVPARARALQNLALVQKLQGNFASSSQNYEAVLSLIASEEDNLSPSLILPLRGLAILQMDTGDSAAASDTFDRATHVSNVNYGPHSFNQLPILNAKMQIYLGQNDPASALDVLDRIYMLHTRKYAWEAEELLPALYQKAEIYEQLNMRHEAYRTWRHVRAIKRQHYAENDVSLVEPNIRMAKLSMQSLRSTVYRTVTTSTAEKHLKRALWIAENSPDGDWQVRKDCLLALADYYTLFNLKGRAHRRYAKAWELMSSNENSLIARAEDFEAPTPLSQPRPDPNAGFEYHSDRAKAKPDDYIEGEMIMAFTVNDRGRTEDFRVVDSDPPNFSRMEYRVRNAVREFVYRPRYVNGEAAATENLQYRAKFFYLPLDYDDAVAKNDKRRR